MIAEMGMELKESNERIVQCLSHLRDQREELAYLIDKQYDERRKLETEMERITYKLCLINKSLAQRERAKSNYDKTLEEIEQKYFELVKNSGDLLGIVQKEFDTLDSIINKKTNTDNIYIGDEEQDVCCLPNERNCKCDERKEARMRKAFKRDSLVKDIELEEPIKLEKLEESSSPGGSDQEPLVEIIEPPKDDQNDEQRRDSYSDERYDFRKYS